MKRDLGNLGYLLVGLGRAWQAQKQRAEGRGTCPRATNSQTPSTHARQVPEVSAPLTRASQATEGNMLSASVPALQEE